MTQTEKRPTRNRKCVRESKRYQEPKMAFFDQCARYRFLTLYLPLDIGS